MATLIGAYDTNQETSQAALKKVTAETTGTKNFLHTKEPDYAEIIDDVNGNMTVVYHCKAAPGTLSSAASWQVKKITKSGNVTTINWADGDSEFDNIADNRASLSYS